MPLDIKNGVFTKVLKQGIPQMSGRFKSQHQPTVSSRTFRNLKKTMFVSLKKKAFANFFISIIIRMRNPEKLQMLNTKIPPAHQFLGLHRNVFFSQKGHS